jgi:hypothetical protein
VPSVGEGEPPAAAKGRNSTERREGDDVAAGYRRALVRPSFESHYRELVAESVERAQGGKRTPRLLRREQGRVQARRPRGRRTPLPAPRTEIGASPGTGTVYAVSGGVVVAVAALIAAVAAVGPDSWWTATPDIALIVLGALWLVVDSRREALGAAAAYDGTVSAFGEQESRPRD